MNFTPNSYYVRTHFIGVQKVIGAEKQNNKVYPTPTRSFYRSIKEGIQLD